MGRDIIPRRWDEWGDGRNGACPRMGKNLSIAYAHLRMLCREDGILSHLMGQTFHSLVQAPPMSNFCQKC